MSFDFHEQYRKDILKELHLTLVRAYGRDYNTSEDYPTRLQPVFSKIYQYFNMGGAYDAPPKPLEEPKENKVAPTIPKPGISTLFCTKCKQTSTHQISTGQHAVNCPHCHSAIHIIW